MRLCVLALLLPLATCSSAFGQEGQVALQFVTFPKTLEPIRVELLGGKGKTTVVDIPSNELSATYRVPSRPTWSLGKTGKDDEGKPVFQSYGKTKSLGLPKQLILVIRKGQTNADGFTLRPLDNRAAGFGGGQFLFVNAASVPIGGEVGARKFALRPGQTTVIKPKPDRGENLCQATLFYRVNQQARPFRDTVWPLQADARGLVFVYNAPRSSSIRLHTIRDIP